MKRTVRLTESRLKRMISETVKSVLRERFEDDFDRNSDTYGKDIIRELLHFRKTLTRFESFNSIGKSILNNHKVKERFSQYDTSFIIVKFGDKYYRVDDVILIGDKDVYISMYSLYKWGNWFYMDSEFDIDDKEISLEEFQRLFPSQYNELIRRFEYVARRFFTYT